MARSKDKNNLLHDFQLSGDLAAIKVVLQETITGELADRLEIKKDILRGGLIKKNIVSTVLGNIYTVYRNQLLTISYSIGDIIAFKTKCSEHKIRPIIESLLYELIKEINCGVEKFVKKM